MVHVRELHRRGTRVGPAETARLDRGNCARLVRGACTGSGGVLTHFLTSANEAALGAGTAGAANSHAQPPGRTTTDAECSIHPAGGPRTRTAEPRSVEDRSRSVDPRPRRQRD